MEDRIFIKLKKIVYEKTGISLADCKKTMVEARIAKRMRVLSIKEHRDYLKLIIAKQQQNEEMIHFIDAISTNVTSFFRENEHFLIFERFVREWHNNGVKRMRFWSCACSSGEEPYSMALTALEALNHNKAFNFKILATDISTRILNIAIQGEYNLEKTAVIPSLYKRLYFLRNQEKLKVKPDLKNFICFKRLNLAEPPFPMKGPLDAVFCRNVMIYFDRNVRKRLIDEITALLKPGGVLFVGHSESLSGFNAKLRLVAPAVYVKE